MPKLKILNATFWVFFNHCDYVEHLFILFKVELNTLLLRSNFPELHFDPLGIPMECPKWVEWIFSKHKLWRGNWVGKLPWQLESNKLIWWGKGLWYIPNSKRLKPATIKYAKWRSTPHWPRCSGLPIQPHFCLREFAIEPVKQFILQ